MSDHRPEYIDLCAAWALGCLDQGDVVLLDEHLAQGCAECGTAMAEFSAATVLVAASAQRAPASPALRERVMAAAVQAAGPAAIAAAAIAPVAGAATPAARPGVAPGSAPRAAPPVTGGGATAGGRDGARDAGPARVIEFRQRPAWTMWVPLAAAAALAIASGVLWMRVHKLDSDLAASNTEIAQLQRTAEEGDKWLAVLHSADARVSVLEPTTDGDARLRARATYDPATKRAVIVFENFTKPTNRDYQLWVIRDGAPASLGVVHADDQGRAVLELEGVGDSFALSAFAVSLEPEGGSPNPTPSGPVVMLGKLSG